MNSTQSSANYYKSLTSETIDCELCSSSKQSIIYSGDRYHMGIKTVICENCGFVFTNPRPTETAMIHFYATSYREFYSGTTTLESHFKKHMPDHLRAQSLLKDIQTVFPDKLQNIRVLDVGCQMGVLLSIVRAAYPRAQLYGIDPKPEFSKFAASIASAHVWTGNIEMLFADNDLRNSFDVIILNHVLEHLYHARTKLEGLRTLVKSNGYLLVEVPDVLSRHWYPPLDMLHIAHIQHFSDATLSKCLNSSGFAILRQTQPTRCLRVLARPSHAFDVVYEESVKKMQTTKSILQQRFADQSIQTRMFHYLHTHILYVKWNRFMDYVKAYGALGLILKTLQTAIGKLENLHHLLIYQFSEMHTAITGEYFSKSDASKLKTLIHGRDVLILGSGKSSLDLRSIPKDVLIFTCNQGLQIVKAKSANRPVDLYLTTMSKLIRNKDIQTHLKALGAHTIAIDRPTFIVHHKYFSTLQSEFVKDNGMNRYFQRKLCPNTLSDQLRGRSKHPWPSSGIRLLQYAVFYNARKIYLSGIDFGENGYAWGPFTHSWMHQDIDRNIAQALSSKYSNIFSTSKTSGASDYFPLADLE